VLRDHAVALRRLLSRHEARVKRVLRARQFLQRVHGLRLHGDEARPALLRLAGAPAQAEGDGEERDGERAGQEQDARPEMSSSHPTRIIAWRWT
jgi:hypothetical protein